MLLVLWVSEVAHLRLRLLKPGPHIHLAVHRRRNREVFACFSTLAHTSVELAEAEMAVGDDRAHAQLIGEGQGLPEGGFGVWAGSSACQCASSNGTARSARTAERAPGNTSLSDNTDSPPIV
jgi:hypothetical protein